MKGQFMQNLGATVNKNLPGILTGVSIVSGLATAALAVYEGMKLKEDFDNLPEDVPTKAKVKVCARRLTPVVVGAAVSTGTCYAAHHEHAKRYVALAGTVAALKCDKEELLAFKEKATEALGTEKTEEVKKEVTKEKAEQTAKKHNMISGPDEQITIHDLETGYIFKTTLNKFYAAANNMNELSENNHVSIEMFYEELLGDDYSRAALHSSIGFGPDLEVMSFRPEFDAELGPDMKPVYQIQYPYANIDYAYGPVARVQTVGGYTY